MDVKANALVEPTQQRTARADFDIIGVRAQAQHRKLIPGSGDPKSLHALTAAGGMDSGCHGVSPRSIISSSTCLSRSVSIARQNPS